MLDAQKRAIRAAEQDGLIGEERTRFINGFLQAEYDYVADALCHEEQLERDEETYGPISGDHEADLGEQWGGAARVDDAPNSGEALSVRLARWIGIAAERVGIAAERVARRAGPGWVVRPPRGASVSCPTCHGRGTPCTACVVAAGDPRFADFTASDGAWGCRCGRRYGIYRAGTAVGFLMQAPGHRQVVTCVRCGEDLARRLRSEAF